MRRILHHGICSGEFMPIYVGTDYFAFYHKPCFKAGKAPYYGHAEITAVLIDNDGRVIFNLKCRSCGAFDALKTHPFLWLEGKKGSPLHRFHLSPKLKNRVQTHWWDNL